MAWTREVHFPNHYPHQVVVQSSVVEISSTTRKKMEVDYGLSWIAIAEVPISAPQDLPIV